MNCCIYNTNIMSKLLGIYINHCSNNSLLGSLDILPLLLDLLSSFHCNTFDAFPTLTIKEMSVRCATTWLSLYLQNIFGRGKDRLPVFEHGEWNSFAFTVGYEI